MSIHPRTYIQAVGIAVPCIVAMVGCSGDQSLGGGLPARDGASTCSIRIGADAGSGLTDGLVLWYRCESATGTSPPLLPDSSSQGNDGTLMTGAGGSPGYSFAPGKVGNALDLSYTNQGYVVMPTGILADLCEVTIATWVYINARRKSECHSAIAASHLKMSDNTYYVN